MDWYKHGIPAAIQEAKAKGIVFLVYITGVDDVSKKMDDTWKESSVGTVCKDGCIGIKLEAKSTDCVHFSQIYPVVCVPCTFLIGTDGVPIEILGGQYEPEQFVQKLKEVFQKNKFAEMSGQATRVASPSDRVTENGEASSSSSPRTELRTASVGEEPSTVSEMQPMESVEGSGAAYRTAEEEAEEEAKKREKLKRAQELIAMKREQKSKEAEEKARNEEIRRRELGKDAAKLKQWQEEKNQKEQVSTWKKEKEEARVAREKVKEQIARDRAERALKFQKDKEEREELQVQKKRQSEEKAAEVKAKTEAMKRETSRLQFRLPDGSNITETFASSETLGTAKVFLNAKVGDTYGNYSLRTTYPKREFTSQEMSVTLLDLGLVPSAALVVIPARNVVIKQTDDRDADVKQTPTEGSKMSSSFLGGDSGGLTADNTGGGGGGGILMLILSPLVLLWNFIYNLLFGAAPATSTQSNIPTPPQQQQEAESSPAHQSSGDPSQQDAQSSALRNRSKVLKSSSLSSRQEGNVRRFTASRDEDDDDDAATYNGNSTQQM